MVAYIQFLIILIAAYEEGTLGRASQDIVAIDDEDISDIRNEMEAREKFNIIFPGTKWCGTGDIAKNYDDLGPEWEADMCCRDHDHCNDLILAGETKYNLTNEASYTRLNCECDEKYRMCLNKANTKTSRRVGKIYFNDLGTKCYRIDYLVLQCKNYGGTTMNKCLEYEYDTSSEQIYQWFDVKNYSS